MENIFTIFILITVVIFMLVALQYARSLIAISNYSKNHNTAIFEIIYKNIYQLLSDIGFLNELWSGARINEINNNELKELLVESRKLLILGIILGLLLFFAPIINIVA